MSLPALKFDHHLVWLALVFALSACGGTVNVSSSSQNSSSANASSTSSTKSSSIDSSSSSMTSSSTSSTSEGVSSSSSAITGSRYLNDTGTTYCRDLAGNNIDCLLAPAQDGNSGRDNATLPKQGAGPAGFDWTKIASDGSTLNVQNLAWATSGSEQASTQWACVLDHQTQLLWEVKSDVAGSLHHRDLRYSWYQADNTINGGEAGTASTSDCNGSLCDTTSYVATLNNLNYCGRSNWRLPMLTELLSLVVTDNLDLVMDTGFFPNGHNDQYWTLQSYTPDRTKAWYLYFSDGSFGSTLKSSPNYLRLVSDTINSREATHVNQ